ncbi:nucleoside phosphorylase domain-containing protein [Xylaria venustula]|nr:nucleoside phosphorylase domain-containing protein [Xylaria venustula]
MTSQPRTRNDYTVGWVCALPKEQTAAIAMLDQEHADLPKLSDDPNTYTLGSIGDHNIVITCLPIGKIGTVSAATVATHMVHAFPSVKFGLMVGIGGGIPPKVRLGDVVVGIPMGQYPGVIQWDLGKEEKGGEFTRTGSLNKPPDSLLGAVSKLRSKNELEGSKIPYYLTAMSSKYPNLAPKYLRSETLQDMLFKAGYEHNESAPDTADRCVPEDEDEDENKDEEEEEEEEEEESCRYCDKTQVVRRKPRDMRVHYGLITSGNRVVKNATFRDNLRRDLGKDVLCIEMEAAGLMDNFPCLVIRGICDYADSHKNKAWQEHAAAVAAAFAKELLGYIQRSDVDRERTVKDALNHISGTLSAIDENVTRTRHYLKKEKDVEILDWLTATDYGPQQSDYLKRRQPGTGQWLIDSGEYQNWIQESNKTLFCPGIPGAGKTILTSIVIDDLEKRLHREITSAVAYIYCNYKRRSEQTPENLLSSLLKQLGQTQPSLPHSLKELYDRHKAKRTRPSLDEIFKVLELVTVQNSRVFIIVDALDECQALDRCRTKFLSAIFNLQIKTRVNILTTSRFIPEITDQFKGAISIEIRATKDDISRYLRDRLPELPKLVTNQSSLQDEITTSITEAVDGMYV